MKFPSFWDKVLHSFCWVLIALWCLQIAAEFQVFISFRLGLMKAICCY